MYESYIDLSKTFQRVLILQYYGTPFRFLQFW